MKRDEKEQKVKFSPSHHTSEDRIKEPQSWKGREKTFIENQHSGHRVLVLITAEVTMAQWYAQGHQVGEVRGRAHPCVF